MADDAGVLGFSEDGARRVVRAVRRVEGESPDPAGPGFRPFVAGRNVQFLRVTGAKTTANGLDYYPCKLRTLDQSTGTYSDGVADLWLLQEAGATLTTDGTGIYPGVQDGDAPDPPGVRPVFRTWMRPFVVDVQCVAGNVVLTYSA